MAEPPACNASPLIVLARAGHLALQRAVYGTVVVPDAVAGEILRGPSGDPALTGLQSEAWLTRTFSAMYLHPSRPGTWDRARPKSWPGLSGILVARPSWTIVSGVGAPGHWASRCGERWVWFCWQRGEA